MHGVETLLREQIYLWRLKQANVCLDDAAAI